MIRSKLHLHIRILCHCEDSVSSYMLDAELCPYPHVINIMLFELPEKGNIFLIHAH